MRLTRPTGLGPALAILSIEAVTAQVSGTMHEPSAPASSSPYAGLESRAAKALSDQQIARHRELRGYCAARAGGGEHHHAD